MAIDEQGERKFAEQSLPVSDRTMQPYQFEMESGPGVRQEGVPEEL